MHAREFDPVQYYFSGIVHFARARLPLESVTSSLHTSPLAMPLRIDGLPTVAFVPTASGDVFAVRCDDANVDALERVPRRAGRVDSKLLAQSANVFCDDTRARQERALDDDLTTSVRTVSMARVGAQTRAITPSDADGTVAPCAPTPMLHDTDAYDVHSKPTPRDDWAGFERSKSVDRDWVELELGVEGAAGDSS